MESNDEKEIDIPKKTDMPKKRSRPLKNEKNDKNQFSGVQRKSDSSSYSTLTSTATKIWIPTIFESSN